MHNFHKSAELLDRVHPVAFRFSHHASPSGYDALVSFFDSPIQSSALPDWMIPNRLIWRLSNGVVTYNRLGLALELKTSFHALLHSQRIYHFIYGENSYKYLGLIANMRHNQVVASFHQPPAILEGWITIDWPYELLSAIIVLGTNQIPYFSKLTKPEKIFFVPHGVDTKFFQPLQKSEPRSVKRILCVGNWLRDYQVLRDLIISVLRLRPEIQFTVIALPENLELLSDLPIERLCGISDAELLRQYQTSTILVLPIKDVVASNTILEGLACGMPIITNDVGSIRDYVNEDCAHLIPKGDVNKMCNKLLNLVESPDEIKRMSEASRHKSLEFDWSLIIEKLIDVYRYALDS